MAGPVELDADALDLGSWVRPGDGVVWSQGSAEPDALVDALIAQAGAIGGLRAFCGLTWRSALAAPEAEALEVVSYGGLGALGRVAAERPVRMVPCHFSALPALFETGALPGDVALVGVAPPGADGRCSLGVDASYVPDAIEHARVVIAEVNDRMPSTGGASVPYDRLDAVVHVSRPLTESPPARESATDAQIAEHVIALIDDGDTIQIGVGSLPEAILRRLGGARDLGLHSGMICDPIVDLVEGGAMTGLRKPTDTGLIVTGHAIGSQRLFDFLAASDAVRLAPVSYTHRPETLARIGRFVAINGAVEVDLTGQVNAEVAGGRHLGAVGGQVDFLRGAAANGGVAVVALPSVTRSGASRIVPQLSGPVTTARSDVDAIVTEHGVARLRGLGLEERAEALIAVAAPEHRDALARAAAGVA